MRIGAVIQDRPEFRSEAGLHRQPSADGLLPLHWEEADEAAMAEERRLFYVGMTRAKDRLILSHARQRLWRGRLRMLGPSPFLCDIEKELVRHQPMQGARSRPQDRQLKLL